ncbi:MAG: adenylate/guanylate cyclase domain-containing protein [Ferruginibacter sp.]
MFTDIVGYTAMMQQHESLALIKLNRYKEALKLKVEEFQGEIIQYFGDGGLVIFNNSKDAVNCAAALQEDFQEEPQVPVRIGIHLGDIIYKEGNIFGDCVNITSRIESMGIPGAVLISESVQQQIKNKPEFKLTSLGNFEFKNVDEPMEIFALAISNFPVINRDGIGGKFKEQQVVKSIAVLPFVNMSNDPEQEYFSDGMAEEIINSLIHLKDLNVAGRTSSFQFKGKNIDLRQVGKKLSVRTVLIGSVRKQANRLRITAQLVNVDDGYHLWSERYDREINDIFAIQDEIALAITEKLRVTLLKKDRDLITKSYTQNTEAYELYLKGKFYTTRRGASLLTSMECFQKAIELDPDFALAHAGYADVNLLLATYGLMPPEQAMTSAKQSAERALELDPTLCQPYCSLGYYYNSYEWNWPEAKKNFLKSIELNPKYAEGHFRYGLNYLTWVEGKFDEAEKHGKIAIKLEPLSSICYATYSLILHSAAKFDEALAVCKIGIELDANSFVCHLNAGSSQMSLQQYDAAISSYESAMKLANRHHFIVNALIWTYCIVGQIDKARKLMDELKERSLSEYIAKTFTALSAAYLDDLDEAFEYLEKAYIDRDPILMMLKYEHWVPASFRNDPRFQKIIERIGFPN